MNHSHTNTLDASMSSFASLSPAADSDMDLFLDAVEIQDNIVTTPNSMDYEDTVDEGSGSHIGTVSTFTVPSSQFDFAFNTVNSSSSASFPTAQSNLVSDTLGSSSSHGSENQVSLPNR